MKSKPPNSLTIEDLGPSAPEIPTAPVPGSAEARRAAELQLTTPRKRIDVTTLLLSGKYMHQDNEAAAFQRMSPGTFSRWMGKRDPDTKLTYREIFDQARGHGRASLLRTAIEQAAQMNAAGVTMMKFVLANEFGWSEKRIDEHRGSVTQRHTHQVIPPDAELHAMSDDALQKLALGSAGGKPVTRH